MSGCGCEPAGGDLLQRRVLITVLLINAVMFVIELGAGWLAQSTALLADALDMLADASVYALSLYAVGRSATIKTKAARLSGILQILLGLLVLADILRRYFLGSEPVSSLIIGIGALALAANVTCLMLIAQHRKGEIHMRASWIFSRNDVVANLGVIAAGLLVALSGSPLPDLIIGSLVAGLVIKGGLSILRQAA